MKKRIVLIVTCLMMLLSSSCFATNWVWVTSDANMGIFFDADSIRVTNSNQIIVWEKVIYDEAYSRSIGVINGNVVRSLKMRAGYHRPSMTVTQYARYVYGKDGKLLASVNNIREKSEIVPESGGEQTLLALEKYVAEHNIKPQK
jgi:hypothetical protein